MGWDWLDGNLKRTVVFFGVGNGMIFLDPASIFKQRPRGLFAGRHRLWRLLTFAGKLNFLIESPFGAITHFCSQFTFQPLYLEILQCKVPLILLFN